MKKLFIEYPKCSTCKNAKKWLIENNIDFEDRNITENVPTIEELKKWIKLSKKDTKNGLTQADLNIKHLI